MNSTIDDKTDPDPSEKSGSSLPLWLTVIVVLVVFCSIFTRWVITERMGFIVDELVDVQLAHQVGNGGRLYSELPWERTPLTTWLIGSVVHEYRDSFFTVLMARKLMWVLSIFIFLMVYQAARQVTDTRFATIALFLLASFSTFLERSLRVRADMFSTLFATPALVTVMASGLSLPMLGFAGFCLGLAFASSQKATYFVAAFAFALTLRAFFEQGWRMAALKTVAVQGSVSALGFLVPVGGLVGYMAATNRVDPFLDQCFFYAAQIGLVADSYDFSNRYLWQTMFRNPIFWLLGLGGMSYLLWNAFMAARKPGTRAPGQGQAVALGGWTLALFLLILNHNVKFPYVFLNLSPCLALCGTMLLWHSFSRWRGPRRWRIVAAAVVAFSLTFPAVYRHHRNLQLNFLYFQEMVMKRVDQITDPEDAVFDGVGIAVTRRKATPYSMTIRWSHERDAGAGYPVIAHLEKERPPVVISTYRMRHLEPGEKRYLADRYLHDWANIYVAGTRIVHEGGETRTSIQVPASTDYAVIAGSAKLWIDGSPVGAELYLTAGEHDAVVTGEASTVLIKYKRAVAIPPPEPLTIPKFFPSYWD